MADAEARLADGLQECRTRLHRVDQQQRGILRALALGRDALVAVVENDGVLPSLDGWTQIEVNRTHAPERRRGQPADFFATLQVYEDDFIAGGMVRQRDSAAQRDEIARSRRSIEPGEPRTIREVVQGELIAPRDGGDLRGLSDRGDR